MVNNLLGNLDFQYINAYYAREVLPHFEKVDKLLGNLGDAAEHRGNAILAEMDKLRTFSHHCYAAYGNKHHLADSPHPQTGMG